jgi:DNA-binding NarL/FixJ family response regulator
VPIRLLLADDNERVRKAICRILATDAEIQLVGEATSFLKTLQLAAELRPDIVVLDLHMTDEQAVPPSKVKSSLADSRLIAISIWRDDASKALADSFGALDLLDKTDLASVLIPAIKLYA